MNSELIVISKCKLENGKKKSQKNGISVLQIIPHTPPCYKNARQDEAHRSVAKLDPSDELGGYKTPKTSFSHTILLITILLCQLQWWTMPHLIQLVKAHRAHVKSDPSGASGGHENEETYLQLIVLLLIRYLIKLQEKTRRPWIVLGRTRRMSGHSMALSYFLSSVQKGGGGVNVERMNQNWKNSQVCFICGRDVCLQNFSFVQSTIKPTPSYQTKFSPQCSNVWPKLMKLKTSFVWLIT